MATFGATQFSQPIGECQQSGQYGREFPHQHLRFLFQGSFENTGDNIGLMDIQTGTVRIASKILILSKQGTTA